MPYLLKPHRHLKIWLSKNPDVFMNPENQWRLVQMRAKNPKDVIHLVYSRELLSPQAEEDLKAFCKKDGHNIIPLAVEDLTRSIANPPEDEKDEAGSEDENERNLYALFLREIRSLKEGGNLAAACDILRWLKVIYSLECVYSDLDVIVDTTGLDETIEVEAPLILRIASLKFPIMGLPGPNDLEAISLNNDTIAVVGHDALAKQKIKAIQEYIIQAYQNPRVFDKFYSQYALDLMQFINPVIGPIRGSLTVHQALAAETNAILAGQLADGLGLVNPDPILLRKKILEKEERSLVDFCREQLQLINPGVAEDMDDGEAISAYAAFLQSMTGDNLLALSKEELHKHIQTEAQTQSHLLYLTTVTHVSGPAALMLSLFEHVYLTASQVDKQTRPYSLLSYEGLVKAFFSTNGDASFHCQVPQRSKNQKIGDVGDQSWTKLGALAVVEREQKMTQAAVNTQRLFRGHQGRKLASEAKQQQLAAAAKLWSDNEMPIPFDEVMAVKQPLRAEMLRQLPALMRLIKEDQIPLDKLIKLSKSELETVLKSPESPEAQALLSLRVPHQI